MSRLADDIRIHQDWGKDGYRFEPKVQDGGVFASTSKENFFVVLADYYTSMYIPNSDATGAISEACVTLGLTSTPSEKLTKLARHALKQEVETILTNDSHRHGGWTIEDLTFPEGWL